MAAGGRKMCGQYETDVSSVRLIDQTLSEFGFMSKLMAITPLRLSRKFLSSLINSIAC